MELGDAGKALRAKAELARRHAAELRREAEAQRDAARAQLAAEIRALEAAKERVEFAGELLRCDRCTATWRRDAIIEATRRQPRCLLCGGSLTPVP